MIGAWNGTTAPVKCMCLQLLGVETRHGLTLHAAVTQCNCTSLMIAVTTSFSVMIIKIITDSDYILQQPSITASNVMINFRACEEPNSVVHGDRSMVISRLSVVFSIVESYPLWRTVSAEVGPHSLA